MFFIPLDEQPGDNFIQAYWHILSDPAHLSVEITLTILIDVLLLGVLWPMIRNYVNERLARQHAQLDAEHGIAHHEDHVHHGDHLHAPEAAAPECEVVTEDGAHG